MRRRCLVIPLLLAVFAGCGGSDDDEAATTPAPPKEPGPLNITRPSEDARVKAVDAGGNLAVRAAVRGTGDAGSIVVVNGGCNVEGCVVQGTAGEDGIWTAKVRLDAPAGEPRAKISAYYRGSPVVGPNDDVEVRLVAPRTRRTRQGGDDGPPPAPVPPSAIDPAPGRPSRSGPGTMVLVGDSLGVGMENILPGLLPGWQITADNETSRSMETGMEILDDMRVADGSVVAASLFTNNSPVQLADLEAAVRATVRRAGPRGCAVWATIARPPFEGRNYSAPNALLHRLDRELGEHLVVVPWAELAGRSGWLAGDQIHATPEGYRQRARLYAEAAQSCR